MNPGAPQNEHPRTPKTRTQKRAPIAPLKSDPSTPKGTPQDPKTRPQNEPPRTPKLAPSQCLPVQPSVGWEGSQSKVEGPIWVLGVTTQFWGGSLHILGVPCTFLGSPYSFGVPVQF